MAKSEEEKNLSRRQFLKITGATAAVVGTGGMGVFGYFAGKDPMSYTGTESYQGAAQTFNRERYAVQGAHFHKVGVCERIDARTGVIFNRSSRLRRQWDDEKGLDGLEDVLKEYYKKNPADLEKDLYLHKEIFPKHRLDNEKYGKDNILSTAWSNAMYSVGTSPGITTAPQEADFPRDMNGKSIEPLKMKSPELTTKLLKKMSHQLGATLVGVAKLNPEWVYKVPMPRRGMDPDQEYEIPKHWVYAIVVGTPMEWDPMLANPVHGTSYDSYAKSRIVAFRLVNFIKSLGYAARSHTPGTDYDLIVPPIAIDAGLGEQGRHSILITPELGSNIRPAVVTTNIPLIPDKPISFGVSEFCKTCKICAEKCPSGSISMEDEPPVVNGYKRWPLNSSTCYNFWYSNLGNIGCRLCISSCPFSRKSNWLHKTALDVTTNDPTGLSHRVLTEMQKKFYPSPDPQDYYMPSMGGKNTTYREEPWWLKTEDFIEF